VGEDTIDIGHVVLGIDAMLHPDSDYRPFGKYGLSAINIAGWDADVAIGMVLLKEHQDNKKASPDVVGSPSPNLEEYYLYSAPLTDLLGDADAYGVPLPQTNLLSAALRAYYLGDGIEPAGFHYRWRGFVRVNGFNYTMKGGHVTWAKETRDLVIQRIKTFADLYALREDPLTAGLAKVQRQTWPMAGAFADRFLKNVSEGLEKELAESGTKKKP